MGEALNKQEMKELERLFKSADLTNVSYWIALRNLYLVYLRMLRKFQNQPIQRQVNCPAKLSELKMGN